MKIPGPRSVIRHFLGSAFLNCQKGFRTKEKPVTNSTKELLILVNYPLFEMPVDNKKQYIPTFL